MKPSNFGNSINSVDAVFLNTRSRGGAGKYLWKQFLETDSARKLGFHGSRIFNISNINNSQNILEAAKSWATESIQKGCRRFVAAGGDGTVHMAVNALHEHLKFSPSLGAIGLGSSNDFHKPNHSSGRTQIIGLPCRLDFNLALLHDLGEVEFFLNSGISNKELFVINSSIGFTAQANHFFNNNNRLFHFIKRISVHSAIFVAVLQEFFRFKQINIQIQLDKMEQKKIKLINLGIVKNPHFAGDFRYDILQSPNDGLFGVYLFGSQSNTKKINLLKWQVIKTFSALIKGNFSELSDVISQKCTQVSVQSSKPIALEMDGEIKQFTQAHFRVLPKEILICP